MKLSDVMQRNVQVIQGDATVREAARKMSSEGIGVLPVCTDDKIAGMLTDRDLVVRCIAHGDDPDKTRVSEVMTRDVEFCLEDDSIDAAAHKMSDRQIQRLLVLNEDRKLVGILSLGDLARARGNAPQVTHALEGIKQPTKSTSPGADGIHTGR
jgi:CBS domain-containing protein